MTKKVKTKFFEFSQNNSGGFFDVDDNVCHNVVIEANDKNHAISIFAPMIENQSHSCPCCGDRWMPEYADEIDMKFDNNTFQSIEQYCQFIANRYGWTKPDYRIHFLDGTKKDIFSERIKP